MGVYLKTNSIESAQQIQHYVANTIILNINFNVVLEKLLCSEVLRMYYPNCYFLFFSSDSIYYSR